MKRETRQISTRKKEEGKERKIQVGDRGHGIKYSMTTWREKKQRAKGKQDN